MSARSAAPAQGPAQPAPPETKGLAANAVSFPQSVAIGLASTAPAYSLAAVLGPIVLALGLAAPAALLVAFVPMLLIAAAFRALNRADPDCGTTFAWVSRAFGPSIGWLGGWAVVLTGVLVVGSLADVGARYLFELVGWQAAAESKLAVTALAVVTIAALTALTVAGTHLTARVQSAMIVVQILALALFSLIAIVTVLAGDAPSGSLAPSLRWLDPFGAPSAEAFLVGGLLVGVFIYWGWESCVNLNEETENPRSASGRAAVASTVILLATYLATTIAVLAFLGPAATGAFEDEAILSTAASAVLGSPLDKLVVLGVVLSAVASTQTTILPASRTLLSMARHGALPAVLGRVHSRRRTPHVATLAVGAVSVAWYVALNSTVEDFLAQTLLALALLIALYYALTGFACVVLLRREALRSLRSLVLVGLAPLAGALALGGLLVVTIREFVARPEENSETGATWLGLAPPLVIGIGFMAVGVVLMLLWRVTGRSGFFTGAGARTPSDESPRSAARRAAERGERTGPG